MLVLGLAALLAWSSGGLIGDRVFIDLDGDRRAESATLACSNSEWVLRLNGREFRGPREAEPERIRLRVVDLKRGDGRRELAVHDPGPSDDDSWTYFAVWRGKPARLGTVANWPTVRGDGTLEVRRFQDFWETTDRYRYDQSRQRLVWHPRRTYPLDIVATAAQGVRVARRPGDVEAQLVLARGTRLRLIAAARRGKLSGPPARDFRQFDYRVRFVEGGRTRTGWIGSAGIQSLNGLIWAD